MTSSSFVTLVSTSIKSSRCTSCEKGGQTVSAVMQKECFQQMLYLAEASAPGGQQACSSAYLKLCEHPSLLLLRRLLCILPSSQLKKHVWKHESNHASIQSCGSTTSRERRKTWHCRHHAGNLEWETGDLLFALCQPKASREQTQAKQTLLWRFTFGTAQPFSSCVVLIGKEIRQLWEMTHLTWPHQRNSSF